MAVVVISLASLPPAVAGDLPAKKSVPWRLKEIERYRALTHECQDHLGVRRSPVSMPIPPPRHRAWVLTIWKMQHRVYCGAVRQLQSVNFIEIREAKAWANTSGPRCVSSHEGAVTSNTGNGYYGKWQADTSFQRAYAPEYVARWGYAHNWPAYAQDVMAYRGWKARGWGPWPNTSRMCGLR